ncbi:hypothetical protein [Ruminococcus sp.]|uniref:hypothetical protein n=1 Tax=Ruminococcus sp. TaxID=41978 RepID=UPI003AB0A89A
MTVKELLNKYDFYDYDKTGFESFAVFFPKDDFEKAKSFDKMILKRQKVSILIILIQSKIIRS